jgi:cytochrome P450
MPRGGDRQLQAKEARGMTLTKPERSRPEDFEWPVPETIECPYPFYSTLRVQAPVYKYPGRDHYLVSRWEDIVQVLEHPEIFIQGGGPYGAGSNKRMTPIPPGTATGSLSSAPMAASDAPEHRLKRSLGLRLVSPEKLRSYEPIIASVTDELIESIRGRGEIEFHSEFAALLPVYVITEILGLARADCPDIRRWGDVEGVGAGFLSEEEYAAQLALGAEQSAYLREAILDRTKRPRSDFLTELVQAQIERDGELALGYLISEAGLLLFAGNVTTTHMLASVLVALLESPELMQRVLVDRSLLRPLVEESLRLESPVQYLHRLAAVDSEIAGVRIPAGSAVAVLLASGNRDRRRFRDPEQTSLQRSNLPKDQLAFGRGMHRCLGAALARLEGEIALGRLFDRLSNVRFAAGKRQYRHIQSYGFRAPDQVFIEFDAI